MEEDSVVEAFRIVVWPFLDALAAALDMPIVFGKERADLGKSANRPKSEASCLLVPHSFLTAHMTFLPHIVVNSTDASVHAVFQNLLATSASVMLSQAVRRYTICLGMCRP